jgi:hypothetical protein
MIWEVKHGDTHYSCPDVETLKGDADFGRIRPEDYVLNPVLNHWIYAKDVVELQWIFASKVNARKSKQLNKTGFILGFVGVVLYFLIPQSGLGAGCLLGALGCGIMAHIKASTII